MNEHCRIHATAAPIERIFGIYECPVCNKMKRVTLPIKKEMIPIFANLSQNKMLHPWKLFCPQCHRQIWLNRAYDEKGILVFVADSL